MNYLEKLYLLSFNISSIKWVIGLLMFFRIQNGFHNREGFYILRRDIHTLDELSFRPCFNLYFVWIPVFILLNNLSSFLFIHVWLLSKLIYFHKWIISLVLVLVLVQASVSSQINIVFLKWIDLYPIDWRIWWFLTWVYWNRRLQRLILIRFIQFL